MTEQKTSTVFDSPEYRRSRNAYTAQCAFEYFVSILVSDAYLAKLLTHIGLNDSIIGIISSLANVAFLFQLTAIFLVGKIHNTKRMVILCSTGSQLLLISLYVVPFLPLSTDARTVIVMVLFLLAYFGNYFEVSILYKWANSYVDPMKRGSFSAVKEMISLIGGMVFTLAIGLAFDRFESGGQMEAGFIFIACMGLAMSICNFICLMLISGKNTHEETAKHSLSDICKNTLGNRSFDNVVLMTCLIKFSEYLTIGFMGTFKTNDLLLSVGTIQLINITGNLFRFFLSKPFGRYSDKTSYASGIKVGLCLAATAFAVNIFSTPNTVWCIVVFTILLCISYAGTNQNSYNIIYSYVPEDYFVHASAIKNSIGGVCGFLASLLGSKILSAVQGNGDIFLGFHVYGQQVLSFISTVLFIVSILFVKLVIEKQATMKQ